MELKIPHSNKACYVIGGGFGGIKEVAKRLKDLDIHSNDLIRQTQLPYFPCIIISSSNGRIGKQEVLLIHSENLCNKF